MIPHRFSRPLAGGRPQAIRNGPRKGSPLGYTLCDVLTSGVRWLAAFLLLALAASGLNEDDRKMLQDAGGWEYILLSDSQNGFPTQHTCFDGSPHPDECKGKLTLRPDMHFVQTTTIRGQSVSRNGRYELDGDQLAFIDEFENRDGPYTIALNRDAKTLKMTMPQINVELLLKKSTAPARKQIKQEAALAVTTSFVPRRPAWRPGEPGFRASGAVSSPACAQSTSIDHGGASHAPFYAGQYVKPRAAGGFPPAASGCSAQKVIGQRFQRLRILFALLLSRDNLSFCPRFRCFGRYPAHEFPHVEAFHRGPLLDQVNLLLELSAQRNVREHFSDGSAPFCGTVIIPVFRNLLSNDQGILAHRPERSGKIFSSVIVHSAQSTARYLTTNLALLIKRTDFRPRSRNIVKPGFKYLRPNSLTAQVVLESERDIRAPIVWETGFV